MAVWTGGGSSGSGTGAEAVARGCAELLCGTLGRGSGRRRTDGRTNYGTRLVRLGCVFQSLVGCSKETRHFRLWCFSGGSRGPVGSAYEPEYIGRLPPGTKRYFRRSTAARSRSPSPLVA